MANLDPSGPNAAFVSALREALGLDALPELEAERFAEVEPILRDYDSEVARVTAEHNAWKDRLESEPKA